MASALLGGCVNQASSGFDSPEHPCFQVDCGDHGECLAAQAGTPACRCEAGFHAEGLSCVVNTAGAECSGVICSGRGECVVVSDAPLCLCESGFDTFEETNCVAESVGPSCGPGTREVDGACVANGPRSAAADPCTGSEDCAEPAVCSLQTGTCETLVADECGLAPEEAGTLGGGEVCNDRTCGAGLTCVPRTYHLEHGATTYKMQEGLCLQACDPCAPDCPFAHDCIALPGEGGFCHAGPLRREGESCESYLVEQICAGGLSCNGKCEALCIPDDPDLLAESPGTQAVSTSTDCGPGAYCRMGTSELAGDGTFVCSVGALTEVGEACTDSTYCLYPNTCRGGTCSPPDCDCPSGIECFGVGYMGHIMTCIADGALGSEYLCAEDRNCGPGLSCQLWHSMNSPQMKCAPG